MKTFDIFYVEDDAGDVDLARTALAMECPDTSYTMAVAEDGEQAVKRLTAVAEGPNPLPDLILLDLNLPRLHGKEVIRHFKQSEALRKIPIVVFTTSSSETDIQESYRLGASSYHVKPDNFSAYRALFSSLCRYWFGTVKLPSPSTQRN